MCIFNKTLRQSILSPCVNAIPRVNLSIMGSVCHHNYPTLLMSATCCQTEADLILFIRPRLPRSGLKRCPCGVWLRQELAEKLLSLTPPGSIRGLGRPISTAGGRDRVPLSQTEAAAVSAISPIGQSSSGDARLMDRRAPRATPTLGAQILRSSSSALRS